MRRTKHQSRSSRSATRDLHLVKKDGLWVFTGKPTGNLEHAVARDRETRLRKLIGP